MYSSWKVEEEQSQQLLFTEHLLHAGSVHALPQPHRSPFQASLRHFVIEEIET